MSNNFEKCRICGSKDLRFDRELQSVCSQEMCRFYVCNNCGTIMDSADVTPDYSTKEASSFNLSSSIKFYAEVGAGLHSLASNIQLLRLLPKLQSSRDDIRYLDVGAGFGFSVHLAKKLGWNAIGVEPSEMGKVGSEKLGIQLFSCYLENAAFLENSFDIISASEVVEHVQDPDSFIKTLAQQLSSSGVLLLTTPNADAAIAGENVEKEWYQLYSPGYHFNIFSPESIKLVLARNGFEYTRVFLNGGSSARKQIVLLAAREEGILPEALNWSEVQVQAEEFLKHYLKQVVSSRKQNRQEDEVYSGALYRLVELLVNNGNYREVKEYIKLIERIIQSANIPEISVLEHQLITFEEYLTRCPAYLGYYYFYKGMFLLNYEKEYQEAAHYFNLSAQLCNIQQKFVFYSSSGWYERAKLHEGIALLLTGNQKDAIQIFDVLLAQPENIPADTLESLYWNNGVAHLQIRENNKAIRYLAEISEKKHASDFRPELHILIALSQSIEDSKNHTDANVSSVNQTVEELKKQIDTNQLQLNQVVEELKSKVDANLLLLNQAVEDSKSLIDANTLQVKRIAENYNRDKAILFQKATDIEALLNKAVRRFNHINNAFKKLALRLNAPGRLLRKLINPLGVTISQDGLEITTAEIVDGRTIEQQILCDKSELKRISLKIGTFNRVNSSLLRLDILDEDKNQIRHIEKTASQFEDNKLHTFLFDTVPDSQGKKFWLMVSSTAMSGNGVTLWCKRHQRREGQYQLFIDGKKSDNKLIYELGGTGTNATVIKRAKDILIITPDRLGKIRIGLGMRHWEIAKALAVRGLKVTLATPHPIPTDIEGEGFDLYSAVSQDQVLGLVQDHKFIMVQGDVLSHYSALEASQEKIIVDMVTPIHIENIEKGQKQFEDGYRVIHKCLMRGDFFICGNERQRVYWLGMLTALGRINKNVRDENSAFYSLIDILGFGIPDEPPVNTRQVLKGVFSNIQQNDFVLMWMGGIWDWLDPLTLIQAVHEAHHEDERIKLFFPAYRQTNGDVCLMAQKAKNLSIELGALDKSVFFNEYPVPYEDRGNYLLESDVGVVSQAANFETQISARTRVLDYLWAGLPILINEGDEWAELVRRHDLGLVISSATVADWKDAILKLASDSKAMGRITANIEKLKPLYYWKRLVEPIVRYVTVESAD